MNIKKTILIYFYIISFFLLQLLLIRDMNIESLKAILFIYYLILLFFTYKREGILGLYFLFLLCFGLFNFSRIFLDFFGIISNFASANDFIGKIYTFNDITIKRLLYYYIYFLIITSLSYYTFNLLSSKIKISKKIELKNNASLEKMTTIIFYITNFLILIKIFLQLKIVLKYGYSAIYNGTIYKINFLPGIGLLYILNYYIFLSSIPKRKNFIRVTVFFIIYSIMSSLKGARSGFIVNIILIIYYFINIYNYKISKKKVVFIFLLLTYFSIYISYFRSNTEMKNIFFVLIEFLYGQGTSVLVPMYFIENQDRLSSLGSFYIVSHILLPFKEIVFYNLIRKGQTLEVLQLRNSLSDNLMYFLNPTAYLTGHGTGASILVEIIEIGKVFFFFLSCIYGFLIYYMKKIFLKNRVCFFISLFFIKNIIWCGRGTYFPNILQMTLCISIYFIYLIFIKLIKKEGR